MTRTTRSAAVLGTIAASAAFYVVMSYAISIGYGKSAVDAGKWISDPAYLDTMATRYVGSWLATIIDLVVILDALGLALAICVTIGRGYFALGRDGLLPSFFAKTSRYETPWVGNLVVSASAWRLPGLRRHEHGLDGRQFVPIFGTKEFSAFIVSATAGSFAVELRLPDPGDRGDPARDAGEGVWWQYLVVLIAIATPLLGSTARSTPSRTAATNLNWLALVLGAHGWWSSRAVWFAIVQS